MKAFVSSSYVLIVLLTTSVFVEAQNNQYTATIRGKNEVVVTKQKVTLSDIAEITAENSEAQLALSKIEVAVSPKPGTKAELTAQKVLDILKSQGVDLERVGYIFSPTIKVSRASRTLSEAEIEAALQSSLAAESADTILKSINLPRNTQIFTGPINIQANLKGLTKGNQRGYELVLTNSDGEKTMLEGKAEVDSWREIPVAARSLAPGSILGALDFGLARLNTKDLPKDTAFDGSDLLGKKIQREVGVGQVFRVKNIERPALIKSGSRINIVFNSGVLEASATGIAMQDGFSGDIIEIKNDTSRRVVSGKVRDQSTVEINQ